MSMTFTEYSVAPKGRNKYGNYLSSSNVTRKVIKQTYAGDTSTTTIQTGDTGSTTQQPQTPYTFLCPTSASYKDTELSASSRTDTVYVFSVLGTGRTTTYVGDISVEREEGAVPSNYSISGIPTTGMTVSVSNNGTSATTITITATSALTSYPVGTLFIPINTSYGTPMIEGDDYSDWHSHSGECLSMYYTWTWQVGIKGDKGDTGASGATGRQGASVRGPVEWDESGARHFSNGKGDAGTEDGEWIDVIKKGDDYYYCITSYDQTEDAEWDDVKDNWQIADKQFDFVATKLLLADNAYIDFTTTQGLYVRNSGGTITGGMQSANSDRDIVIWAGSTSGNTQISNAPFRVSYDGAMTATSGEIGGWTIDEDKLYWENEDKSELAYLEKDWLQVYSNNEGNQKNFKVKTNPDADEAMVQIQSETGTAIEVEGDAVFGRNGGDIYLDGDVKAQYGNVNFESTISFDGDDNKFKIKIVDAMPSTIDDNTLYFVKES